MAREKLKDFLTSGGASSTSTRLTYTLDDKNSDGMVGHLDDLGVDPGTGKELLDLDTDSTGLLGDFVKFIVDEANNTFRISSGNSLAATTNRGDSLPAANTQGSESVFVEAGSELGNQLGSYSNSGKFDGTSKTLSEIINKTGPDDQSSHRLLSDIKGSDIDRTGKTITDTPDSGQTDVTQSSQEILLQHNRFKPGSAGRAYAEISTSDRDFSAGVNDSGTTTSQRDFGNFDPDGVKIVVNKLKNVGASLLLKSAGWDVSETPGSSADPENFSFTSVSNPEPSDGSRSVDPGNLRSKNASGAPQLPTGISTRADRGEVLSMQELSEANKSYGTTTTYGTQFSATNNTLLRAQAVAAIISLLEASKTMFNTVEVLVAGGTKSGSQAELGRGPYFSGEHAVSLSAKLDVLRRTVLVKTAHNYIDCVNMGLKIFFSSGASVGSSNSSDDIDSYQHIQEAPGFWLAIARTVIRSVNIARAGIDDTVSNVFDAGAVANLMLSIGKTKMLGFLNVAATVGDSALRLTGGNTDILNISQTAGPRNVDSLPLSPATRIAKSRSGDGSNASSLAWRGSSLPSLYALPTNIISAAQKLGTVFDGTNPARGMLASQLAKKTYVDPLGEGPNARISSHAVRTMEDLLDAEYVPFYFHDLRTNEIVAFHAFLENLTESYSANYSESTGYGRIDPVLSYNSTKRSINLTFFVAATSKDDFDEMWWKINKITTLVYPKWTEGTRVTNSSDSTFIVPFSQVISSSPMIRLRIGDVIKGNYSKFNLARIFGVGNTDINPAPVSDASISLGSGGAAMGAAADWAEKARMIAFYAAYASPVAAVEMIPAASTPGGAIAQAALLEAASAISVNGFANPIGTALALRQLADPDMVINTGPQSATVAGAIQSAAANLLGSNTDKFGYDKLSIHNLKANQITGYKLVSDGMLGSRSSVGTRFYLMRPVRVMVMDKRTVSMESRRSTSTDASFKGPKNAAEINQKTIYTVMVIDTNAPYDMFGASFDVTHSDVTPSYHAIFNRSAGLLLGGIAGAAEAAAEAAMKEAASAVGVPTDNIDLFPTDTALFMNQANNAIVRSFDTTKGRGLAGFIRSLNYNWLDGPWEIDWNSRAPKYAKIQLQFDVVHDLPPGLDYSGYNRAPLYNVGDIMRSVAGDPYDDDGDSSKDAWTAAGAAGFRSEKESDN